MCARLVVYAKNRYADNVDSVDSADNDAEHRDRRSRSSSSRGWTVHWDGGLPVLSWTQGDLHRRLHGPPNPVLHPHPRSRTSRAPFFPPPRSVRFHKPGQTLGRPLKRSSASMIIDLEAIHREKIRRLGKVPALGKLGSGFCLVFRPPLPKRNVLFGLLVHASGNAAN